MTSTSSFESPAQRVSALLLASVLGAALPACGPMNVNDGTPLPAPPPPCGEAPSPD